MILESRCISAVGSSVGASVTGSVVSEDTGSAEGRVSVSPGVGISGISSPCTPSLKPESAVPVPSQWCRRELRSVKKSRNGTVSEYHAPISEKYRPLNSDSKLNAGNCASSRFSASDTVGRSGRMNETKVMHSNTAAITPSFSPRYRREGLSFSGAGAPVLLSVRLSSIGSTFDAQKRK